MKTSSIHLGQSSYYLYLIFFIAFNIILAVNYKFHYFLLFIVHVVVGTIYVFTYESSLFVIQSHRCSFLSPLYNNGNLVMRNYLFLQPFKHSYIIYCIYVNPSVQKRMLYTLEHIFHLACTFWHIHLNFLNMRTKFIVESIVVNR